MRENGFTVQVNDDQQRASIRNQFNVPLNIQACHTAIVDGYIIEGHVPVAEIDRLLTERPDVIGLAVIGMPAGSPGMDGDSSNEPFDVVSFDGSGNTEVYASYP